MYEAAEGGMKSVGFVGLGLMGAPMAANVARAGFPLTVFNRTREKAASLAALGAEIATTPAELAGRSQVVITMLTDAAAVELMLRGQGGLLAGGRPGTVLIDMSTVSPQQSCQLEAEVLTQGWLKLEAPVLGSTGPARQGTLEIVVGGERELFEAQRDLLQAMGKTFFYMGPMGAGALTKLAFNLMVGAQFHSLAEAMALAATGGIEPGRLGEVLTGTAIASDLLRRKIASLTAGDFAPGFPLKHLHKDLGLMLDTAHRLGVPLPATGAIHETLTAARSRGHGDRDSSSVYCLLAELSGHGKET
jgi:3-hydroxyisobutyrate dehydrogenase-like beta-hydroxyacid dehydrogenase